MGLHDAGGEWALLWKTSNVFVRTADQQGSARTRRLASDSVERFILGSRWQKIVTPLNDKTSGLVFVGAANEAGLDSLQGTWVAILQGPPPSPLKGEDGSLILANAIDTHEGGLSLVEIKAPLSKPASALISWLGASLVPSSSSGVFLALVDAASSSASLSSSSSSSSLHRFVHDLHQAKILPRPVPAKMTKHLRRSGLLHSRKAEAALEEERERERDGEQEAGVGAPNLRAFRGLQLLVPRAGLVPKQSSGVLVDAAVAVLRQGKGKGAVLDLGTGSGALLLAAIKETKETGGEGEQAVKGVGVDLDDAALEAAQHNVLALGLASQATFIRMDFGLLHEKTGGASALALALAPSSSCFSVVVSNPPYLAAAKAEGRVTSEGKLALVGGGARGLGAYSAICSSLSKLWDQHPALLCPDCALVLQLPGGDGAADAVREEVEAVPGMRFRWTDIIKDARGVKRAAVLRLNR